MRAGLGPREWEDLTPAEIWAYGDGAVWRRQQDLGALAVALEHFPALIAAGVFGKDAKHKRDVPLLAQILRAGVRSDQSARAVLHGLRELEAGLVNDLHSPSCSTAAQDDQQPEDLD